MDFLSKKKKTPVYNQENNDEYTKSIPIDLADDEDFYYVYADVPGKKLSDIKLKFKGNDLSLRIVEESEEDNFIYNKSCIVQERLHDEAERIIELEDPIDKKTVNAKLEDGVLKVTVKKIDPSQDDESDLIKISY